MKVKTKKGIIDAFLTIIVLILIILGVYKSVEIVKAFRENKKITRELSVVESEEILSKSLKNYKANSSIKYDSDYMSGFKKLGINLSDDEQEFLYILSKDYDLSYPLLLGLIELESNFNKDEISDTNDYGLMQINEVNHDWLKANLGFEDIMSPYNNMRSGVFILSQLSSKYDSEDEFLMAYNMGEAGAKRLWDKGIKTSKYSEKVISNKLRYERLLK